MAAANPASSAKPYLRDYFSEQRKKLCEDAERKNALDLEIQTRLLISREYRGAETILIYMARPAEIATSLIIHAAFANGKKVALPVCLDGQTMVFRRIETLADLVPGRYGILEPPDGAQDVVPDENTLCVCPALCCDMRGYRLGFGGGYYDRYLAGFPGTKAALCYADSFVPLIKEEAFDMKMDVIHTDSFSRRMK